MYNELSKLLCNQVQIFFEIPDSSFQIPVSSFRFQLLVVPLPTHVLVGHIKRINVMLAMFDGTCKGNVM